MRPANVFQLEMALTFSGTRSWIMKLGFTSLLGLPFVLVSMPPAARVSGLCLLVLFVSFFGASVSMVRRRLDGHITHFRLLPLAFWKVTADIVLAGALVDFLQTGPLLVLFSLVNGPFVSPGPALSTAFYFVLCILLLNFLGTLLGLAMKGNPEAHLLGALLVGLTAFLSGLLPAPERVRVLIEAVGPWNPIAGLAGSLRDMASGSGMPDVHPLAACLFLGGCIAVGIQRAWEGKSGTGRCGG